MNTFMRATYRLTMLAALSITTVNTAYTMHRRTLFKLFQSSWRGIHPEDLISARHPSPWAGSKITPQQLGLITSAPWKIQTKTTPEEARPYHKFDAASLASFHTFLSKTELHTALPTEWQLLEVLNLTNCGLRTVPYWVKTLPNLKILILSGNPGITINPGDLPLQIEQLYLDFCGLSVMPDLHMLDKLHSLALHGNMNIEVVEAFLPPQPLQKLSL